MAATDATPVPIKNQAYRHYFAIRDVNGDLVTTWAGQDSKRSLDGATVADCTNEAVEIATNSGTGYIELTATEMNTSCTTLIVTVTNTDAKDYVVNIYPVEDGDVPVNSTQVGGSTAAADKLSSSATTIVVGTVDTVTNTHTPTTTEFQADDITESTTSHFNGRIVIFTSGVLINQAAAISGYTQVGGIGQFTVTAMTEAPADNDTFVII